MKNTINIVLLRNFKNTFLGKKYFFFFFLFIFLISSFTFAQDIHFTQFYEAPLILNPALTGYMEKGRVAANYRKQALGFTNPYETYDVSFDAAFVKNKRRSSFWGGGLLFFNDRSGDGHLNTMKILFSGAFHKALDLLHANNIALGVQAGLVNKNINTGNLTFPDQYNDADSNFDPSYSSGENLGSSSIYYPDVSVGLLWYFAIPNFTSYHLGFNFSHINFPKESFLGDNNRLLPRTTIHGGTKIIFNYKTSYNPRFVIFYQKGSSEFNLGGNLEYQLVKDLRNNLKLFTGAWYRFSNSANVVAGMEYNGLRAGVSYDLNVKSVVKNIGGKSAIEFSLSYIAKFIQPSSKEMCPKFE